MLRTLFLSATLGLAGQAAEPQTILDCTVTEVLNDNVFEESLTVEEYPEVQVTRAESGKLVASVGANMDCGEEPGDEVIEKKAKGKLVFEYHYGDQADHHYTIAVDKKTKKGVISSKEDSDIAALKCE